MNKYRVYLKDGTTIDCVNIREKDNKYLLSFPNETRNLSFDEVDMVDYIGPKVFGCEIDSMALGLEPHLQEAMLRSVKKNFETAQKNADRLHAIKEEFKQTYGVELIDFLEEAKYALENGETSVHHYPFCDWVEVDNFIDGIVDAVKTKNGSK